MATLTNEGINAAVLTASAHLEVTGINLSKSYQAELILEEVMIGYQQLLGESSSYSMQCKDSFFSRSVVLSIAGDECDILRGEEESSAASGNLLSHLLSLDGVRCSYRYVKSRNVFSLSVERSLWRFKLTASKQLILSILLGVILALATNYFMPSMKGAIIKDVVTPLIAKIAALYTNISCYFIFFAVITTMCTIGDTASFRRIGSGILKSYALYLIAVLATAFGVASLIFTYGDTQGALKAGSNLKYWLDIIPTNPLQSLVRGDSMQITILAFFLGAVIFMLGDKVLRLREAIGEVNLIFTRILELSAVLMAPFIILCVYKAILTISVTTCASYVRYVLYLALSHLLLVVLCVLWLWWRRGMAVTVKMFGAFKESIITGGLTASPTSVLPARLEGYKKLKIDMEFYNFYIPFSHLFIAAPSILYMVGAGLYVADLNSYAITAPYVILVALLAFQFSIAKPKVSSSFVICITMLLGAIGANADVVGPIVACVLLFTNVRGFTGLLVRDVVGVDCALAMGVMNADSPLREGK